MLAEPGSGLVAGPPAGSGDDHEERRDDSLEALVSGLFGMPETPVLYSGPVFGFL
ncbi:hypothetical protein ACFCZ7_09740 [Streptomyces bauhiniae]|uniref:hypothetical protein n=1 Tax=Streptomyces bauhiniae TaxID=2340725 RepID=UPI0035DA0B5F